MAENSAAPAATSITRPERTWAEFVKSHPNGKSITIADICMRWCEFETVDKLDSSGKVTGTSKRSKENGEQRAYAAWILGAMEPEEASVFSTLQIRVEPLVLLAIVPVVRELKERSDRDAKVLVGLLERIERLEAADRPRVVDPSTGFVKEAPNEQ